MSNFFAWLLINGAFAFFTYSHQKSVQIMLCHLRKIVGVYLLLAPVVYGLTFLYLDFPDLFWYMVKFELAIGSMLLGHYLFVSNKPQIHMKTITQDNITLVERVKAPSPKLFQKLQWLGGTLAVVGGALVAIPVLPVVAAVGGYMIAAGTVAAVVSKLPVDFDALKEKQGVNAQ